MITQKVSVTTVMFLQLFLLGLHLSESFKVTKLTGLSKSSQFSMRDGIAIKAMRDRNSKLSMAIKGPVRYTTSDWFDCLITWPTSSILKRVQGSVFALSMWTGFLVWIYKMKNLKFLLPAAVHSIAGATLGLLLVFRTNSSYDRFWEGRKCWSSVVTACRDIARYCLAHVHRRHYSDIGKLLVAFALSMKQHLQGEKTDSEFIPFFESSEDVRRLQLYKNRPTQVLHLLGTKLRSALKDSHHSDHSTHADSGSHAIVQTLHEHQFEHHLHTLGAALSACERIVKQPVPVSYSRHTSRFLTLYLLSLPFTLISLLGWISIPTMTAIGWSFLSVQEIGHYIEDPFDKETQIIPLNLIVSVLRKDIAEQFGDGVLTAPVYDQLEEQLLSITRDKTRIKSDYWFEYY